MRPIARDRNRHRKRRAADRPYRAGMPFEKVCRIMEEGAGTHFDPQLVEPFLRVVRKLHRQGKLKRSSSAPGKTPRSS
ncbi:MAG: hypothetical protein HY319_11365 [Armatimonadetes bacterium]|nr:hypothetical protein [Armatimonadota bacterium]